MQLRSINKQAVNQRAARCSTPRLVQVAAFKSDVAKVIHINEIDSDDSIWSDLQPHVLGLPASLSATHFVLLRAHATSLKLHFSSQAADSIGLDTSSGIGGFTPFAEQWVGRWAQLGFVSSIVGEFVTGRGTLGQLGLETPSLPLLVVIVASMGVATLAGTANTLSRLQGKQMTKVEIDRYRNFLNLDNKDDYKAEAAAMKRKGDFTTPGNDQQSIDEAKAAGAPVDAFLSTNEKAEGSQAATQMKTQSTAAEIKSQITAADDMYFGASGELTYAKGIEITNGRWAMIGFAAAIIVEASTGEGIIGQCITYLKWSGILGDRSGF